MNATLTQEIGHATPAWHLPDETLEPLEEMSAVEIGGGLVPFSYELDYLPERNPDHVLYKHAAHVLLGEPDSEVAFVSINMAGGVQGNDGERVSLDIALEVGEASKVMPIINLAGSIEMAHKKAARLKRLGINSALLKLPAHDHDPDSTAKHLTDVRETGELKNLGVIIPVSATSSALEATVSVPVNTTERLAQVDFGVTEALFDRDTYSSVVQSVQDHGVRRPIIPGIRPFRDLESVKDYIRLHRPAGGNLFRDTAPVTGYQDTVQDTLNSYFASMATRLITEMGAPGLHIYTANNTIATNRLVEAIKWFTREDTQTL